MNDVDNQNHIYFRFMRGVAELTRRSRRAQLLADILERFDFKVRVQGDLVVGRILHLPKAEISYRLKVLGALVGFTRQLDIQLRNDQDVEKHVEAFVRGDGAIASPGVST